jgi:two-component system sensor histidine kinase QseC
MTVTFELDGSQFTALNGGPHFTLSEAASLVVRCDSQEEIDRLWDALVADGGSEQQCGWLRDRFGMSWQVVPARLHDMLASGDAERQERVMAAVFAMVRLDIEAIEAAWRGQ